MTEVAGPGDAAELSEAAGETEVATAEGAEESEAAPTMVDVICGTLRAKFLVESWRVVVDGAHTKCMKAAGLHCVEDELPTALASMHAALWFAQQNAQPVAPQGGVPRNM